MIPVILSGGSGSRLWPLSRKQFPKQFLALTGAHTLFQQTIERLVFEGMDTPIVVCNKDHKFIVQEQLNALKLETQAILMEPFGRNTAPAVAMTAMKLVNEGRDELMLVLPADHVIEDQKALQRALALATVAAERGEMVLFGVPATKPETGYGYIRSSQDALLPEGVARVAQFVEKPDEKRANEFVHAGGYFWNSGMFLFRASRFLEELKKHDPDIYDTCLLALERSDEAGDVLSIDEATFACCPDNSIDYAVMEKTQRACVVPLSAGWSDVGCWSSLWDVHEKDADGNVTKGDVVVQDSRNCMIHGNGKLVSVIGLENIVVVETKDAMMIAHKDKVQGSSSWSVPSTPRAARKPRTTWRCTARGARTTRWTWAGASRSSTSPSSRVPACRCRCTTTAPSTGSWCPAQRKSPATRTCSCSPRTSPPTSPSPRCTACATRARSRWRSSRCSPGATWARMISSASRMCMGAPRRRWSVGYR